MKIFDRLFGRRLFSLKPKLFSLRPNDAKMLRLAGRVETCQPCKCPIYYKSLFGQPSSTEPELHLHLDVQDEQCDAWKLLENLVEAAVTKQKEEFAPGLEMPPQMWRKIVTLPRSIAKLTSVTRLYLYGSNLVRIPPEIGAMTNLEELDVYTSYRLHWLPYEITHCRKLKRSRVSTRAIYGNYKNRLPFPRLGVESLNSSLVGSNCSVCGKELGTAPARQVWISLRVGKDVFPLLVNSCSEECIQRLPKPPDGYVSGPHTGGPGLQQPQFGLMIEGQIVSRDEYLKRRGMAP